MSWFNIELYSVYRRCNFQKYNNNGSIKFFTTLSLSFMSNIISSIISYFISKLADYVEFFEFIIKDVTDK